MLQAECDTLLKGLAEISGFPVEQILSKQRTRPLPSLRYFVCEVLLKRGYPPCKIAKQLNIDHATVYHGQKQIPNIANNKNWQWEYRIYVKFKEYADKQE